MGALFDALLGAVVIFDSFWARMLINTLDLEVSMKKRGSLVFALCAMVGAVTIACSDDSGDKVPSQPAGDLVVSPDSMTLAQGQTNVIDVTYVSGKDMVITSANADCVKVDGGQSKEASTNSEGKLSVNATAVGEGCSTIVTVMDKKDETVSKNVNVKVLGAGEEMPILTLTPDSLSLTPGGSDTAVATYKLEQSGTAIANKFLELSSTNPACANPASTSVETDASGNADIKVIANDGGACNAMITVKPPEGTSKSINVSVSEGDEPGPGPVVENGSLAFNPEMVQLDYPTATPKTVVLTFSNPSGSVENVKVDFEYEDESCIEPSIGKKKNTDSAGKIEFTVSAKKGDCTSKITAKVGEISADMTVVVGEQTEYNYNLEVKLDDPKCEKVGEVYYIQTTGSCNLTQEEFLDLVSQSTADENDQVDGSCPILKTFKNVEGDVAKNVVWAYGKGSSDSNSSILAYGCKEIGLKDINSTVTVDLTAIPTQITGTYSITTNFDFTSAIDSDGSQMRVESMSGSDWLAFLFKFIQDPIASLYNMIWENSVMRLGDISGLPDAFKKFLTESDFVKELGLNFIKPMLEDFLKEKGKTSSGKSYYKLIVDDIFPIASDVFYNMQLRGKIVVDEAEADAISKGSETFDNIEYLWTFDKTGCVSDAYNHEKECRKNVILSGEKEARVKAITGNWNGLVKNDQLTINSHSLDFRWASIIAAVIVGHILPEALGYTDKLDKDHSNAFMALIEKFGFDLISDAYASKYNSCAGITTDKYCTISDEDGSKQYPALAQSKSCPKAFEALVYLIYLKFADSVDTTVAPTVISLVTKEVCNAIGGLEDKIWTALDSVSLDTSNALTLEANSCQLYDLATTQYQEVGKPDSPVVSAHDVFSGKEKSSRCEWDLRVGSITDKKPVKGLFHGNRVE